MDQIKIAVIVGSLRRQSINKKLAVAVGAMFSEGFDLRRVEIADLPPYNQDFDHDYPAAGQRFKQEVEAADALLFVTPEYNRSIPGVLKNAIDVGSRPAGSNSFSGKPAAVIGTSPGTRGSALAQQHLRNVLAMPQPELAVQFQEGLIDDEGVIGNERTQKSVRTFVDRYSEWLVKVLAAA
ncbi:MAG: NAD(P)H-dependent oxidoreductase [Pseudoxanthomonas sp.]